MQANRFTRVPMFQRTRLQRRHAMLALGTIVAIAVFLQHLSLQCAHTGSLQHGKRAELRAVPGLAAIATRWFMPPLTGLPSDAWRPMIFRDCYAGMPLDWAPCLDVHGIQLAEEVVYPDFRILLPRYIDPSHEEVLEITLLNKPCANRRDKAHIHYLNQHGRNFIFEDAVYQGTPPAGWGPGACMDSEMVHLGAFTQQADHAHLPSHDFVMFAASPDSYSFQHFIDRVTVMLAQTSHLRNANMDFITLQPRSASVLNMWQMLANASQKQLLAPSPVRAKALLLACDAPLWHPYNLLRTAEMLVQMSGADPKGHSTSARKVIVTLPRNDGSEKNGGRRWLNYDECAIALQVALDERGNHETVKQYKASEYSSFAESIRFFNENVRLIIGMHGGGMYNAMWVSADTPVIELRPKMGGQAHGGTLFWELSSIKNLTYWTVPVATTGGSMDAIVDCKLIVRVVKTALEDKPDPRGAALKTWYQGRFQPGF
ncbi:MAG: hypothetical protein J3K34DRAFT_446894 [Monoraphidium minutum]|nr:MAG: hypothetical protein J3K34DRAFT_446894 [Monoraphidium minutum]